MEPLSGRLLQAGASATTVREVVLDNSYHVATLDNDAPTIFAGSVDFIESLRGNGTGNSVGSDAAPADAAGPPVP